jgi:hypothetical protein
MKRTTETPTENLLTVTQVAVATRATYRQAFDAICRGSYGEPITAFRRAAFAHSAGRAMTPPRQYPPIHRLCLANAVFAVVDADDPTPEQTAWVGRILNALGGIEMQGEWGVTMEDVVYERLEEAGYLDAAVAGIWVREVRGVPERWSTRAADELVTFLGGLSTPIDTMLREGLHRAGALSIAGVEVDSQELVQWWKDLGFKSAPGC